MRYLRIVLLGVLASAVLAVFVLLLWSGGGDEQTARAYPGLTVGIDLNPSTSDPDLDGVYDPVDVNTFESCIAISGAGVEFDVDVFVLDVLDLTAFMAGIEYDGSVLEITGVDTDLFLGSPPGSNVVDGSFPGPPGKYEAAAFDQNQVGADGSGVLARFTVQGVANGLSPFNLDLDPAMYHGVLLQDNASPPNPIGDTNGDTFFDGPFINEETTISVGGAGDTDGDGDGIPDFIPPGPDNCRLVPNPFDADGDGQDGEDPIDGIDNDADTLVDEDHEMGQEDWNNGGGGDVCQDTDGDGVMDYPDNCRSNANPFQEDMDGDGVGNVCDPDKDGDDLMDDVDNCPDAYNPDQADADGNGTGDACQDSDGDGWFDTEDNCPAVPNPSQDDNDSDDVGNPCDNCQYEWNPGQENNDGDALGDACDWDDDNDSICDPGETSQYCTGSDNCQLIANGPSQGAIQCVGNQTDTNGDGLGDACDPNADSDLYPKVLEEGYGSKDCDASSTPEGCDSLDNDGDTLTDEGLGDPPTPFADTDADTVPDCTDGNVDTDSDGQFNPNDLDDDGDDTDDTDEVQIVTDSLEACSQTSIPDDEDPDALPPDFNDDQVVNIVDLNKMLPPPLGSWGSSPGNPDPNGDGTDDWTPRRDLVPDGVINLPDLNKVLPAPLGSWGEICTP